jgi:hypothetical protein
MKTLKKLHAKVRKWAEGSLRRQPTRQARLGIEALERRELLSANPLAWAWTKDNGGDSGVKSLSTVRDAHGNMDEFVIGADNSVWYRSLSGSGQGTTPGWVSLGKGAGSVGLASLSTARDTNGNVDVFGVGTDQKVYYGSLSPSGAWGGLTLMGNGTDLTSISAVSDASDNVYVFGISTDNSLWYDVVSAGVAGYYWQPTYGSVTSMSTILDVNHNVDVFGIGMDSGVWYRTLAPSRQWATNWTEVSGLYATSLSTALDAFDNVNLFAVGTDQKVHFTTQSGFTGVWSGWTDMGTGSNVSSVSAISDASDNVDVYAKCNDNSVWYDVENSRLVWSGWMATGGKTTSISAVDDANGNGVVFGIGMDSSVWYRELVQYSPANGTLFGVDANGNSMPPSYLDVHQGGMGDCWLLASLAEVAAREPSVIQSMFTPDGTTTDNGSVVPQYLVRFYDSNGHAQYVTVDTELPVSGFDQPVGGSGAVNGSTTPVLWVALAEKAYVEANAAGIVTSGHVGFNDYQALAGGWPEWALGAITPGSTTPHYAINPTDVASKWNAGELVVLCTTSPTSSYIVGSHCYALVNYDPSSSLPYEVFNPWGTAANGWVNGTANGTYGLFWADANFLSANYSSQAFGVGAAPGRRKDRHARSSQELADLAFLADLLDPHAKARKRGVVSPASAVSVN